jgi:hypothetical protein
LNNFHSTARKIELREQLPRSRQKEIEVEALELSPKPLPEDPSQPGLQRWLLELKPKQEQTLVFRYEVKFPDSKPVQGME